MIDESMLVNKVGERTFIHSVAVVVYEKNQPPSVKEVLEKIWEVSGNGQCKLQYEIGGNPAGRNALVYALEKYGYTVTNMQGVLLVDWKDWVW